MSFLGSANRVSWELDEKVWLSPANQGRNRAPKAIKSARLRAAASHCTKSNEFLSFSNTNVRNSGISASKLAQKKLGNKSFHLPKKRFTVEDSFIAQAAHLYLKKAGS